MGWLSDKMFGKRQDISLAQIRKYQQRSQDLVNEELGIGRQLRDTQSAMNRRIQNIMAQQASQTGAQVGAQSSKLAAQTGMSPGQAMMSQTMGQNQAMGGVNQNFIAQLGQQFDRGTGLIGQSISAQRGLDENLANAYVGKINAHNARRNARSSFAMNLGGNLLGSWAGSQWGQ